MTMRTARFSLLTVALFGLLLTGCNNVKEQLGVGRHSPDEFTVVKRAPLTLPPDYSLRAPSVGATPPASQTANQAKTILLGAPVAEVSTGSADSVLLQKMKVQSADPAIRDVISEENGIIALENQKTIDLLLFWEDPVLSDENIPASEIDPKKEAERLKANKESGTPVNEGEVPVIEKKQGAIDKMF